MKQQPNHQLSSSSSPVQRALHVISQYYNQTLMRMDYDQKRKNTHQEDHCDVTQALQFLYTCFVDDLISTSQQVLSFYTSTTLSTTSSSSPTLSGLQILYNIAFFMEQQSSTEHHLQGLDLNSIENQALCIQILNEACIYIPIMNQLHHYHSKQFSPSTNKRNNNNESIQDSNPNGGRFPLSNIIDCSFYNESKSNINDDDNDNIDKIETLRHLNKYIQSSMSFYIKYILYVYIVEDNAIYESIKGMDDESSSSNEQNTMDNMISFNLDSTVLVNYLYSIITKIFKSLTSLSNNESSSSTMNTRFTCLSTSRSLLHSIITEEPQAVLDEISKMMSCHEDNFTIKQKANLLYYQAIRKLSTHDEHNMKPRELALYRKKLYTTKQHQRSRCRRNAIIFCKQWNGIDILLHHGMVVTHHKLNVHKRSQTVKTQERKIKQRDVDVAFWRREVLITISKITKCFLECASNNYCKSEPKDEDVENGYNLRDEELKQLIIDKFFGKNNVESLTIEIMDKDENSGNDRQENLIRKCLLCTSLLLADGELGAWVLSKIWVNSKFEFRNLVCSTNENVNPYKYAEVALPIASELASATTSVESARAWIKSCTEDGMIWQRLLMAHDQEVRSGAALAMAKLGLADKAVSSDEGELMSLLEVAGGLVIESSKNINDSSSGSLTQLERGIELLSYLSSKTTIKDEVAHGFTLQSLSDKSLLEFLVDLSSDDKNKTLSSAVFFGLSSIFSSLAVSLETLRKEAFTDKEITAEQYDQLQSMGKTAEEKELEQNSRIDSDNTEAVSSRIQIMADKGVCSALVNIVKQGTTPATHEQVMICMMRMATEQSVRGKMIQAGCLSECIKISNQSIEEGTLSHIEQKNIRLAQHTIAKLLVTTNPGLLTTSQRIGSIQPLMKLVKDHEASDLQRFESLLSLTNLGGYDHETKRRILSLRGLSVLSYAMFSDHTLVRTAATEAMSNLVPHPEVIEFLRQPEKLKVWVAFSSDFIDNYECARAALGCIAMITSDPKVTDEFCKLKSSNKMVDSVLSSGKLELMHRVLVALLNIQGHNSNWIISSGSLSFCEAYVAKYHNHDPIDLGFSAVEKKLFMVTIDLAKDIVTGQGNE